MNIKWLLVMMWLCMSSAIIGQDEHFSQFYAIPMHMNPALTGAYDGTYRMTAIYRDQWNNNLESGFRTFAAGGDTSLDFKIDKKNEANKIGIGLFFVNDQFSPFQVSNNRLSAYGAFHKRLGDKTPSYLGAGIQFGVLQHNINYDNLTFEDQFNQINAFDGSTSEVLPANNFGTVDVSIGLNYSILLPKSSVYVGAAIHHFNEPSYSFYNQLDLPNPAIDVSQKLESKLVAHASLDYKLNYAMQLQPRFVFQNQGIHNQLDAGTNLEYTFSSRSTALILGLMLTAVNDLDNLHLENVTPLVGIRKSNFLLGFSYDINLGDATSSAFRLNTFEFSIRFSGEHSDGGAFCPTF